MKDLKAKIHMKLLHDIDGPGFLMHHLLQLKLLVFWWWQFLQQKYKQNHIQDI